MRLTVVKVTFLLYNGFV